MNNNNKSKYQIILEEIKKDIFSGKLKPGQIIPSENHLSKEYEISRVTVRKALSILVNKGFIFTVHGKGNFVSNPNLTDFTIHLNKSETGETMEYESKLLEVNIIKPPDDIKIHMQIYDNKKVVIVRRTILHQGTRIAYDIKYMPYNPKEPILEKEFHYINYQSDLFPEGVAQNIKKTLNIRAGQADTTLSEILHVPSGYPVLIVEERIKDTNESIIGYGSTYFVGNQYKLTGM